MGQRRERLDGRKEKQRISRAKNAPRKAKERIRSAARKEALGQKLESAGY